VVWCPRSDCGASTLSVATSRSRCAPARSNLSSLPGCTGFCVIPSYTGILLAVSGLGFFIGNWLSVVTLTGCFAAGLVYRISVEEEAMLSELGERYRDFAASRKRLIPYIW
jgi:hypothetical protein